MLKRKLLKSSVFDEENDDKNRNITKQQINKGSDLNPGNNISSTANDTLSKNNKTQLKDAQEEVDPLDVFMADMKSAEQSKTCLPKSKSNSNIQSISSSRPVIQEFEEKDNVELYCDHLEEKGIDLNQISKLKSFDMSSDEEVYAIADAIDQQQQNNTNGCNSFYLDEEDYLNANYKKPQNFRLPPVDHSQIKYMDIRKNFYKPHESIKINSSEEIEKLRQELDIRITGHDIPHPCMTFPQFNLPITLTNKISKLGYTEPTPIQKQAIPIALSGRDMIGLAKTGSGKTLAFILPMLVHIWHQPELEKGDGPIGIVLAPTRELVQQIYQETKKFASVFNLKTFVLFGGVDKTEQVRDLKRGYNHIIISTPGRLIDMIRLGAVLLARISFLVLDEADKMFDMGFEPQIRAICMSIRPDRQTLLFSATLQKKVEKLTRDYLNDAVLLSIGFIGQVNKDVKQYFYILKEASYKWDWLVDRLKSFAQEGLVIIFVSTKNGVEELYMNLNESGHPCVGLHGDLMQQDRDKLLKKFKIGEIKVLVTTDIAARGLDIQSVKTVINFDSAKNIDAHVHRIGRTGRAGEKGTAHNLLTRQEERFAYALVKSLQEADEEIPEELMELSGMRNKKNHQRHLQNNYRRGGHHSNIGHRQGIRDSSGGGQAGNNKRYQGLGSGNNNPHSNNQGSPRTFTSFQKASSSMGASTSFIENK